MHSYLEAWPRGFKTFPMLNSSKKFQLLNKTKIIPTNVFLSFSDVVFLMLINVKMPTIVGILTFMSRINFVLSWVEYEKSLITSGPVSSVCQVRANLVALPVTVPNWKSIYLQVYAPNFLEVGRSYYFWFVYACVCLSVSVHHLATPITSLFMVKNIKCGYSIY